MDELLQQLAQMGLDFDPNDPQFQRIFLANKASQRELILNQLRQSDAQQGFQFDEKAAGDVADEEVFQNSLRQFLTESGQLPAMEQSQIARQSSERLQTEQDPTKRVALQQQLARLQRLSGLNMNQEEPGGGIAEFGRSAASGAANLLTSPGRFVGRHIGLGNEVAGLESELANIAPARVTSPTGRFSGELLGTALPFAAASKLPLLASGGATLGEMGAGLTAKLGRFVPGASRLAPTLGGGAIKEGLKAAARTAIPSAVGGASEFAVLDPAGTEEDPMHTLLMGALLGQGRTLGAAKAGAELGSPVRQIPMLGNDPMTGRPRMGPKIQDYNPTQRVFVEEQMRRPGADVSTDDLSPSDALDVPTFQRNAAPVEAPTEVEPRQPVKGYDLASQIDRELGSARDDLARTRVARIQRELTEARDKRNALLLREHSTALPEPQREELLAMESHLENLMRDLQNARESLRGGAPGQGAPFRALEAARKRIGKPKRR